jgi:hypothetical protein
VRGEPFTRPDGRVYRARKPGLRARAWGGDDEDRGVVIFGTLDPQTALDLARRACAYWYERPAVKRPKPGWWRDGYRRGERCWVNDERRGAPGVSFTYDEDG